MMHHRNRSNKMRKYPPRNRGKTQRAGMFGFNKKSRVDLSTIDLSTVNIEDLFHGDAGFTTELQELKKTGAAPVRMPAGSVAKLQNDTVCFDFSGVESYPVWMETQLTRRFPGTPPPPAHELIKTIISVVGTICPAFGASNPNAAICAIEKTSMDHGVEYYIKSFIKCFIKGFNDVIHAQTQQNTQHEQKEKPEIDEYIREQQSLIYFNLHDFDETIQDIPNISEDFKQQLTDAFRRALNVDSLVMFKANLVRLLGKVIQLKHVMIFCSKISERDEAKRNECMKNASLSGKSFINKTLVINTALTWLIQTWKHEIAPVVAKAAAEKAAKNAEWIDILLGKSSEPYQGPAMKSEFDDLLEPQQPHKQRNPSTDFSNIVAHDALGLGGRRTKRKHRRSCK
jgi:hypothetical protein